MNIYVFPEFGRGNTFVTAFSSVYSLATSQDYFEDKK